MILFSLTSDVKDKETTALIRWDDWGDCWYCGPHDRLPYLGDASQNGPLLTTAENINNSPHGTIVSNVAFRGKEPSSWIYSKGSLDHIWYWINENDCDANRERGTVFVFKIYCEKKFQCTLQKLHKLVTDNILQTLLHR